MKLLVVAAAMLAAPALSAAQPVKTVLDAPEKAADKQDKIICKRFAEIGSLVATERVCHTKREWENYRSNLFQRGGTGSCAGPGGEMGGTCG